jgi:hypothetical protein
VAEQPLQEEAPAELLTVWPLPDLLTNPHADSTRVTFSLLHSGQAGVSPPSTRVSKALLHLSQWYSYIGMEKVVLLISGYRLQQSAEQNE